MPFPTTPVVPRRTNGLQAFEDVLQGTSIIPHRPVQRLLPEKVCLSPTLPAGHHAPTLTTHPGAGGQRPTTAADVGKALLVSVDVPSPGVSGDVVCRDEGTRKKVLVVSPPPPSFYYSCPREEVDPLCPALARPPRTQGKEREFEQLMGRHKQRGRCGGGNKDHRRKSGGFQPSTINKRESQTNSPRRPNSSNNNNTSNSSKWHVPGSLS